MNALRKWKADNNVDDALVPRNTKVGDILLGENIANYRKMKKKYDQGQDTYLTAEHISELNDEGMVWGDVNDYKWNRKYEKLVEFHADNEHCDVPQAHPELGYWSNNQRKAKANNKLDSVKVGKLEGLGFKWVI
ncbi:hypothetical protein ACHAWC_006268 [Mediolabrus comicus]